MAGYRPEDPDWVRFHLGFTNPTYFALYARRRMELYGATVADFTAVKVKNAAHGAANPNARYRKRFTPAEVMESAMVADPLRLLHVCATSDGGAAVVLASLDYARRHNLRAPRLAAISTVTPRFASTEVEMPDIATDSAAVAPGHSFRASIAAHAYEEAGIGPEELSLAEVYDLAASLELDWYEHLGLCEAGGAEALLRSGATAVGGRLPVNASGGLACFGEAVPAQALAQVCELVWQLRGQAAERQVANARVGISANQGLFGHASAVIVKV
jgi:acetyl-CoA acetyltransferase